VELAEQRHIAAPVVHINTAPMWTFEGAVAEAKALCTIEARAICGTGVGAAGYVDDDFCSAERYDLLP
jgi:hypothetical protein